MIKLPEILVNKILLYNIHPISEILRPIIISYNKRNYSFQNRSFYDFIIMFYSIYNICSFCHVRLTDKIFFKNKKKYCIDCHFALR